MPTSFKQNQITSNLNQNLLLETVATNVKNVCLRVLETSSTSMETRPFALFNLPQLLTPALGSKHAFLSPLLLAAPNAS